MSLLVEKMGLGTGSGGASLRHRREPLVSRNRNPASSSGHLVLAPPPSNPHPRSSRGFTLLEVLAAIALLAFAFAIGLRAMSGALGNGARGEAMTQAALEAQSLLDMQGLDTALSPGVQQGRFPDGANWSLRTSMYRPPVESANPASAFSTPQSVSGEEDSANPRGSGIDLFRLDLDVRYAGSHTLHLSTLKAQLAQQR